MKKLIALLLAGILMLSLTACFGGLFGTEEKEPEKTEKEEEKETEPEETEPEETEPEETEPEETEPEETEPEETEPEETEPEETEPEEPVTAEFTTLRDGNLITVKATYTDNIVSEMEFSIDLQIPKEMKGMETFFVKTVTSALDGIIRYDFCKLDYVIEGNIARLILKTTELEDPDNLEKLEEITKNELLQSFGFNVSIDDYIYYDDLEDGLLDNGFEKK